MKREKKMKRVLMMITMVSCTTTFASVQNHTEPQVPPWIDYQQTHNDYPPTSGKKSYVCVSKNPKDPTKRLPPIKDV